MSHWDFGRPAAERHDTPPYEPDWAAYRPVPEDNGDGNDGTGNDRPGNDGPGNWAPDERRPPDEPGLGEAGRDEDDLPYPLTYERGVLGDTAPQPAVPPQPGGGWFRGGARLEDPRLEDTFSARPCTADAFSAAPFSAGPFPDAAFPGGHVHGHYRGRPRWLIPAGIIAAAAAVGASVVMLAGGHSASQTSGGGSAAQSATPGMAASAPATAPAAAPASGQASAAPSAQASAAGQGAPLTLAQAQAVLAAYTTANNAANAQRSGTRLAAIETGSSFAIDQGLYQMTAGTPPFPPFAPVQAAYYIPRGEPAAGPRWFAVRVGNAFTASPKKVTSTEYLLFTQTAPGGAWQNAAEPYLLSAGSVPQVTVGPDGLATAVGAAAAAVAVAPGRLAAATAASLDNAGGQPAIAAPGNLADRGDQRFWQGKVPGGTVTDTHSAAAGADGQEFALLTSDGGALVFYTDAAQLTITSPAGGVLHLTIPGFYSPGQALTRAGVTYLEQFAAYDPPAAAKAGGPPRIVADYSGITGRN